MKVAAEFKSDEDPAFVRTLFEHTRVHYNASQTHIEKYTANWDIERIVFMDNLIIATAIAELVSFPSIPIKVTLDEFIEVLHKVAKEARENPDAVKDAPLTTSVRHLDETGAAKNPILTYKSLKAQQ